MERMRYLLGLRSRAGRHAALPDFVACASRRNYWVAPCVEPAGPGFGIGSCPCAVKGRRGCGQVVTNNQRGALGTVAAKACPGRPQRTACAVAAARRLPCGAQSRGPPQNSLRSLRSLRSNRLRQVRGRSALRARATSLLLLGAPDARRSLPERAFAGTSVSCERNTTTLAAKPRLGWLVRAVSKWRRKRFGLASARGFTRFVN